MQSNEGKYLESCTQLCFSFFSLKAFSASVSECNASALVVEGEVGTESRPGEEETGAGETFAKRRVKISRTKDEMSSTCRFNR